MPTEYRVRLRSKLRRELCLDAIESNGVCSQGPILKAIKRRNGCWTVSNLSISSVFSDYCHTLSLPHARAADTVRIHVNKIYYYRFPCARGTKDSTPIRIVLLLLLLILLLSSLFYHGASTSRNSRYIVRVLRLR